MAMTESGPAAGIESLSQLYEVLPTLNYEPLWTIKGALTPEPATEMVPCIWRYSEVRELISRAGELIAAEDADRRVLAFKNPGTGAHEIARTTDMLWAAVQLVLPGEVAPPHRHTAAALRFVIEGEGGYTVVDGHRLEMEPGDFMLTPNWTMHEHGHAGQGPMIWLDGLDLPMVNTLKLLFSEFGGEVPGTTVGEASSVRNGAVRPVWAGAPDAPTPIWKLGEVEAALEALRTVPGSRSDDLIVEYRDPGGGPVMPTISAYMQLLRAGFEGEPHRHTASTVYHVVRGTGVSSVAGEDLSWGPGDTFAVPTWAEHAHSADDGNDALVFSFSDEPAVRALGLYRAQPAD